MQVQLSYHAALQQAPGCQYWLVVFPMCDKQLTGGSLPQPPSSHLPPSLPRQPEEEMEKDVEAEGATNMCGDNLVVCGAVAEGLVVFIFILVVCLVVGFSAY